ncbi:hypothetical protein AOQ84DRAFT_227968 [Glonium stellatum]|uniref:Rhodopsin domain-containing protein n=1 Tax=Glonium stellatum TaxID=574774 RepID=A0A8E2EQW1_9PEZI|nr:hypothetical protein AOQ84DRAFT_227968 [Glonium stellatum]
MSARPAVDSSQESRATTIVATVIILWVIGSIGIPLRLWARRKSGAALWWDDWLVIIAWVPFAAVCIANLIGVHFGAGRHTVWVLQHHPDHMVPFLKYIYTGEILYPFVIVPVKCSICCLYIRIFGIYKAFRWYNYLFIVITVLWGLANLFGLIFQCHPIHEAWNPSGDRSMCVNLKAFLVGTNTPNVILDFLILVAPIPLIWRLHLLTRKKILIIAVLTLGAGETAFSLIRLAKLTSLGATDLTWDYFIAIIWSTVEPSVGLLCVCVPVLGPLLPRSFMDRVTSDHRSGDQFYRRRIPRNSSYIVGKIDRTADFTRLDGPNQRIESSDALEDSSNR